MKMAKENYVEPPAAVAARVRQAIRAKLLGGTYKDVAVALGMDVQTIYNYMSHYRDWAEIETVGIRAELAARKLDNPIPAEIVQAVAYRVAGETREAAASRAGIPEHQLGNFAHRFPRVWAQLNSQAKIIRATLREHALQAAKKKSRTPMPTGAPTCEVGPLSDTEGEGITLDDFFQHVYRPLRLLNCSSKSVEQYVVVIRSLDRFAGRPVHVADLTDELMAGFMASHLNRGNSAATANKARAHLLALCSLAVKKKLLPAVPDVDKLKTPKRVPIAWDTAEVSRLLEAAARAEGFIGGVPAGEFWVALLLLAYDTGLRIGAIIGLERSALDAKTGWLRVPAEVQKQAADQLFRLHPDTLAAVGRMLEKSVDSRLFPWPYHASVLPKRYRRLLVTAGLPTTRRDLFHKLRRTSATAVADKFGRAAAQDHLGHSAMSVTMVYLDPTKITRRQVADEIPRPALPSGFEAPGCTGGV